MFNEIHKFVILEIRTCRLFPHNSMHLFLIHLSYKKNANICTQNIKFTKNDQKMHNSH